LCLLIGAGLTMLLTLPWTGTLPWLDYPTVLANLSAPADTADTLAPTVWLAQFMDFLPARIIVTAIGLAIITWSARRLTQTKLNLTYDETQAAKARSFAVAVTVSVLIAPALYHHYLALLVLQLMLGLAAGVPLRYLALAYFLALKGTTDQEAAFRDRFDLMALQRNLKALGTFGYQTTARGNPVYIQYIPLTLH
jgi:hypothetical protein